jgi:hypothetical protein
MSQQVLYSTVQYSTVQYSTVQYTVCCMLIQKRKSDGDQAQIPFICLSMSHDAGPDDGLSLGVKLGVEESCQMAC